MGLDCCIIVKPSVGAGVDLHFNMEFLLEGSGSFTRLHGGQSLKAAHPLKPISATHQASQLSCSQLICVTQPDNRSRLTPAANQHDHPPLTRLKQRSDINQSLGLSVDI